MPPSSFEDLRADGRISDPAAVAQTINEHFERRLISRNPDPMFDWVGRRRDGPLPRWRRSSGTRSAVTCSAPWTAGSGAWTSAPLTGYVGAIVKAPGDPDWRPVRAGRGQMVRTGDLVNR